MMGKFQLLERDERVVATLSRGMLSHVALESSLESESLVLSDRRIYYKGSIWGKYANIGSNMTGRTILSLDKVNSYSIMRSKNYGLLFFSILLIVIGLAPLRWAQAPEAIWALLVPGVIVLIAYFANIQNVFVISTSSTSVAISYRLYGEQRVNDFMSAMAYSYSELCGLRQSSGGRVNSGCELNEELASGDTIPRSGASATDYEEVAIGEVNDGGESTDPENESPRGNGHNIASFVLGGIVILVIMLIYFR